MIPFRPQLPLHPQGKPRASGDDPVATGAEKAFGWVNPARAGMILQGVASILFQGGKPRASGDDPSNDRIMQMMRK